MLSTVFSSVCSYMLFFLYSLLTNNSVSVEYDESVLIDGLLTNKPVMSYYSLQAAGLQRSQL